MSPKYNTIKYYFSKGWCSLSQLRQYLALGAITQAEFYQIIRETKTEEQIRAYVVAGELTVEEYEAVTGQPYEVAQ